MVVRLKLTGIGILVALAFVLACAYGYSWHWLVFAALVFSWVGDAMLARFDPVSRLAHDPFIAGMSSFAAAQVLYTAAFSRSLAGMPALHYRLPGSTLGSELIGRLLPVFLLAGVLFWVLAVYRARRPAYLKVFALIYACLLCCMAAYACAAAFTGVGFVWPLPVGGILFMVSDGCIGTHIFQDKLSEERRYDAAVWGTYFPAQVLLLLGASWLH